MDKQTVLAQLKAHLGEMRERFSVKTLSLFGSVARNEAVSASDVDVLVSFEKKANFDIFMDLKFYLEELLGTGVDLVTNKSLRPQIRDEIETELINVT
ncbi:nucleotidyltransferase family protein [Planctomycetota bacterium]